MENLVKFWRAVSNNKDSLYVHPEDYQAIEQKLKKFTSYEEYINAYSNSKVTDTDLHAGLLPVPYIGDVLNAEIYLLMLNPGFSHDDYVSEKDHAFRKAIQENLLQNQKRKTHPFFYLKPTFLWTGGGRYWERRFREYAKLLASKKNISYAKALEIISKKIAILELSPYHSERNGLKPSTFQSMKSTEKIVEFVKTYVLQKAKAGEAGIIVARGNQYWQLRKSKNVVVYKGQETRHASISIKSQGSKLILKFLGLPK